MPDIYDWLSGKDVSQTATYKTIMKYAKSEDEGKSLALRLIIHYMGDIHQPLHSSNRYSKEHPTGDKGGNDFALKGHYKANELHAVWDSVIYQYHNAAHLTTARPYNGDSWKKLGDEADELARQFRGKIPSSKVKTTDFASFRDESFAIAAHVYDGLTAGKDTVLPASYISKYTPIAKERVVLAAQRLAYMIKTLYEPTR
jgi:hypothetical protein